MIKNISNTSIVRPVGQVLQSQTVKEGAGVTVHRAFPGPVLDYIDPFLLLDEMGPTNFQPDTARGFPDHPHKGFETVTYLLSGAMRHRDSAGNEGLLGPGDLQWMTAGRGIVHSEMPDPDFAHKGGLMHGFQLWVNLPRKDKLVVPRYQELSAQNVPVATTDDGMVSIKIIAGSALGVVAPIETHTDMLYLHFTLKAGAHFVQPVPASFNVLAYVIEGQADFGNKSARTGQYAIFEHIKENQNSAIGFRAESDCQLLLIGGAPLNEPVARWGPFVMNTKEEIAEAVQQYQSGQLGQISR